MLVRAPGLGRGLTTGNVPVHLRTQVLSLANRLERAFQNVSKGISSKPRTFAELLIDCEEDRTLRAVLVGMLREQRPGSSG